MTPEHDPEPSLRSPGGLFRAADHVLVVRSGSTLALLDLERGTFYVTTPAGARVWAILLEGQKLDEPRHSDAAVALGSVASYLLDLRLIEPRPVERANGERNDGGKGGEREP